MSSLEEEFWDEDAILKDLLFESNMSVADIAKELGWSQSRTYQRIKQLGLSWVKRNNRKLSRGAAALTDIFKKIFPGEIIVNEHHVGERLFLDIYCPSYQVAAEYHGRQHFVYSNLFFNSAEDFKAAQGRDSRKIELCKELGIALVTFRFNDEMTESIVMDRILEAIRTTPKATKVNSFEESMKQRRREYNKTMYQKMKAARKK